MALQLANILLAIGGDTSMIVPKYNVTAAEVALLRALHGEEAVTEIQILPGTALSERDDSKPRTNREELARLRAIYAPSEVSTGFGVLNSLYPGAAARVFEDFEELDLPDDNYAAERRATPDQVTEDTSEVDTEQVRLEAMSKAELLEEAERRNVTVNASDKKADILKAIMADKEQADADEAAKRDDTDVLN